MVKLSRLYISRFFNTRLNTSFGVKRFWPICACSAASLLFMTFAPSLQAQEGSNIWIGKLNIESRAPINQLFQLTKTPTYSNQPYFFDSARLYYTQQHGEGDNLQTDIHLFDLITGKDTNLTQSPTSEYSATPVPGKAAMSVIRVNSQGKQELWEFDLQGNPEQHLFPGIEPVGYQLWTGPQTLLLYVLGAPQTLRSVDMNDVKTGEIGQTQPVYEGLIHDRFIGASLNRYKKSSRYLYSKNYDTIDYSVYEKDPLLIDIEQGNWLYAFNSGTNKISRVAKLPDKSQYFAITPSGYAITSDGEDVLSLRLVVNTEEKLIPIDDWKPIKIPEPSCQKGVSRINISLDGSMIALVCPAIEKGLDGNSKS